MRFVTDSRFSRLSRRFNRHSHGCLLQGGHDSQKGCNVNKFFGGVLAGALFLGGLGLYLGVASFQWPWNIVPEFTDVEVTLTLPNEARIIGVQPIALDCRARVFAEVDVDGRREHELFGRVYRTDRVEMTAVGDVDTCVEGTSAEVQYHADGTTEVVIPGDSIVFVRPRIDAVATADSVSVSKGFTGRLTDVFPWVDTDLGLTPLAYAYAQDVIGSSECMETAYSLTEQILIDAYTNQFIENGADAASLTVRIDGRPDFGANEAAPSLGDLEMAPSAGGVACTLSEDLGGVSILQ